MHTEVNVKRGREPTAPVKAWCVRCAPPRDRARVCVPAAGVLTWTEAGWGGRDAGGTVCLTRALLNPYSRQSPQRPRTSALQCLRSETARPLSRELSPRDPRAARASGGRRLPRTHAPWRSSAAAWRTSRLGAMGHRAACCPSGGAGLCCSSWSTPQPSACSRARRAPRVRDRRKAPSAAPRRAQPYRNRTAVRRTAARLAPACALARLCRRPPRAHAASPTCARTADVLLLRIAAQGFSSIAVDAAHYYDTSEVVINTLVTASNTAQIIVVRSCAACAARVAPCAPLTGALLARRHWCGR